jgi:GWxTD domain-containing protein
MKNINYIKHLRFPVTGLVLILSLFFSCKSSYYSATPKWNLAAIYNPTRSVLHPSYKVFHTSSTSSLLFLKVFTNEVLFQPLGNGGSLISDIDVEYTLFETSSEKKHITDSGTYNYNILQESTKKSFISQIPLKAEEGKSYSLKIMLRDNLRKTFNLSFVEVEKREDRGQQYFNITNQSGEPLFKNVIIGSGAFRVLHSNPTSDKLYISYYSNNTPLPKPTYASSVESTTYSKRDSLYIIDYSPDQPISLSYEGMYYMQFDTNSSTGVSVTRFEKGFPKVTKPKELIEPLAYITTSGEYNNLKTYSNEKLAVDDFWIKNGGNAGRGREMIRIYYNRVYFANYYFTNTTPGWKTDRGMVYIVYGPPHNMKKTASSETWLYYRKRGGESISFNFNYNPGKFNINQYQLERSESQNWHWREAVYAWTNGEIFLLD